MISHVIRYIASPMLGHIGVTLLCAGRDESDRADTAELNEAIAIGERNEARKAARHLAQSADRIRSECAKSDRMVADLSAEVDRLRSELDCAAADDEQHTQTAAALHSVTTERDQLRCRCDALTARASKAEAEAMGLQRDLAYSAVRVRQLEEQVDAADTTIKTLQGELAAVRAAAIFARVAARAASCPSRQVADPLAIDCPTCLARSGTVCNGSPSDMTTY